MTTGSLSHSLFDTLIHDTWHGLAAAFAAAPAARHDPYNDAGLARLPAHIIQDIGLDPHRMPGHQAAGVAIPTLTHRA